MMQRIKLLHTVLSLETGGLERLVTEMSLKMDRNRFDIEVCSFDKLGPFADLLTENGIRVTLLQRNQERYDAFYPLRLMRFLYEKKPQLLHMHTGTFYAGSVAAFLARTPATVYTDHGRSLIEKQVRLKSDRVAALIVDRIVAVSEELKDYLIRVVKLPRRKIITVINGVDTSEFQKREKPAGLLAEFSLSSKSKIIGTVGRLAEVKDHLSLIKAFKLVYQAIPDTHLLLAGDGPMKQELSRWAMENGLNSAVTFAGYREDIPELLNLFDIFVLSSVSEGTSRALLEAMASGLPAVVTNVGGNASIVDHGENGLVVQPKNVNQLSEAIIDLLKDEEKHKRFSQNAVRKIRDNYSLDKMVEAYTKLYLELLLSKKGVLNS